MLKCEAQSNLDDALVAHDRSLNSVEYRWALDALICDQPCVLTLGRHHNQAAGNIANALNRGEGDLITLCKAFAASKAFFTPQQSLQGYVFDYLVGVNAQGVAALKEAQAHFAADARRAA